MVNLTPFITQRPDLNPYRYAGFEIWNRLKWDLNPESRRSRQKIKAYDNKYLDQKAVIICNGPSLLNTNFSLLENTFTFGLNKINLLFHQSDFRPSCIVAVNKLVLEQNSEFYDTTEIPLFLDSSATKFIKTGRNTIFLHTSCQSKFARDCSTSIYHGYTVTFVAMQLAFYMGFKSVALIGCDHNFINKGHSNAVINADKIDQNHFDPDYFSGGVQWQLPDIPQSEASYSMAKETFLLFRRSIVNSTVGGNLEIYPRMSLEKFLNEDVN